MAHPGNGANTINGSSNYSEAFPVTNRNLAGYKQFDDLLDLLKKLHRSGNMTDCIAANAQIRVLNTYLSDDQQIQLMKCRTFKKDTVARIYSSVKELSLVATKSVLRWGHTRKSSSSRRKNSGNRRTRSTGVRNYRQHGKNHH